MGETCHIAVIADDLTGAADTGVQFCPAVGPVHLTGASQAMADAADMPAAGLALFTNTRHAEATAAADVVGRTAGWVRRRAPRRIYKKIDSCLRGNLGAELDALLAAVAADACLVAPAFPQQGRVTVDDVHRINGVPVADTEIGRDPQCPVHESRLSVLLARQSRLKVGRVNLERVDAGPAAAATDVRRLLDDGCRHIVFDAAHASHLDTIARVAEDASSRVLPVGSAGLAVSLAKILQAGGTPTVAPGRPHIHKWLFVCGSASRVMADQVAALAHATGWPHHAVAPSILDAAIESAAYHSLVATLSSIERDKSLVLSIASVPSDGPTVDPGRVVERFADMARTLTIARQPEAIFLSGGDTAEAFCRAMDASALLLREEILPGLVRGNFVGGPLDGLPVVTKAGAFGSADTLNRLIHQLQ